MLVEAKTGENRCTFSNNANDSLTVEDFGDHPGVADGASDLFRDVFGAENMAVRSVIGAATLPLGVPVELEIRRWLPRLLRAFPSAGLDRPVNFKDAPPPRPACPCIPRINVLMY